MISVAAACQSLFPPQRSGRSRYRRESERRLALIPHAAMPQFWRQVSYCQPPDSKMRVFFKNPSMTSKDRPPQVSLRRAEVKIRARLDQFFSTAAVGRQAFS